jgi:hypothetical protein
MSSLSRRGDRARLRRARAAKASGCVRFFGPSAGNFDRVVGLALLVEQRPGIEPAQQRPQEQVGGNDQCCRAQPQKPKPAAAECPDHRRAPQRGGGIEAMDINPLPQDMIPAPRKPMPETTWAATRVGSPSPTTAEKTTNPPAPSATSALVRSPRSFAPIAAQSRSARQAPAPEQAARTPRRGTCLAPSSLKDGGPRQCSQCGSRWRLPLQLRNGAARIGYCPTATRAKPSTMIPSITTMYIRKPQNTACCQG